MQYAPTNLASTAVTYQTWDAWAGPLFKETCLQTMAEHRGGVTALAFAGDCTLISTARDGSIRLWRPQRGRKLLRFPFFCCVKCISAYPLVGGQVSRQIGKTFHNHFCPQNKGQFYWLKFSYFFVLCVPFFCPASVQKNALCDPTKSKSYRGCFYYRPAEISNILVGCPIAETAKTYVDRNSPNRIK